MHVSDTPTPVRKGQISKGSLGQWGALLQYTALAILLEVSCWIQSKFWGYYTKFWDLSSEEPRT